jgi:phosphatidylinositol alpha-mannosyltransferase
VTQPRPKVALVCPYDWTVPGGVGNHIASLAAELRRRGWRVDVLAPARHPVEEAGFVGLGGSLAVPYNGSVARIAFGPRVALRVRRALAAGGYDLVHVHEPLSPSAGMLAANAAWPERPVVGTFHANLDRSLALTLGKPLLARTYRRLAARIAVSSAARDTWQRQFGGAMAVIPNGVAAEFFTRHEPLPGYRDDGPTLLFVGRLEPRKGLHYLVRAFLRLKPAYPRLRLLVVGRDDRGQQDKVMAMVPPRLRTDLHFVGAVPQEDLLSYYASADVFCAPSLGGESFGIVLAEAMAMGLPVVCSNISGYRDLIRDGHEGLLVPPRDPEALAVAIGSLLDNPARRAALSEVARASATRYAWDAVATQVAEVYQEVLPGTAVADVG